MAVAEKAYRKAVTAHTWTWNFYAQHRLVEFLMRRGDIPRRSTQLSHSWPKAESIGFGWDSRVYVDRALAYWASKEIGKATDDAILAAELSLTPGNESRESLAKAVLTAYILTRQQPTGSSERVKADKLLAQAVKRAEGRNPYSLNAVLVATFSNSKRNAPK